jgi:hypothetical protein
MLWLNRRRLQEAVQKQVSTEWKVVGGLDKGDMYLPSARASVMARPIPRPPPVMRTSLPEKSIERGIVVEGHSGLDDLGENDAKIGVDAVESDLT